LAQWRLDGLALALPKVYRLKRRQDFSKVYQSGFRRKAAHFHLVVLKNRQGNESQFGISISKKVSKRAVVRNLIKRRIKAALRTLLPRLQPGWWLIVVVRSEATECDYWQILQELEYLLVKAEVLHGD
jgi:ribonuclease P protein component